MIKSSDIKSYFKKIGIPVRVRTVACKNPFFQVWIETIKTDSGFVYKHEFPLDLRQSLLKVVYGENCDFAAGGSAGNIRPYSLSFTIQEWQAAQELLARN